MSIFSNRRTGFSHRAFLDALGVVLHDLRNPLGVIINVAYLMTQAVQDTARPLERDALRDHLALLSTAAHAVLRLLGSVSQVVDASSGQDTAEPERIDDFGQVLRDITDSFQPQAGDARVLLFLRPSEPLPAVYWDIHQIRYHVLNNLITNAIEAASPGGIVEISARAVDAAIEIRVMDDGPGIPPEHRSRIFQRHVRLAPGRAQADSRRQRGLGLYSAELFTRLHRGSLTVEGGADGQGTAFVLRLPGEPFAQKQDGQPPSRDLAPANVRPQYTAPDTVP